MTFEEFKEDIVNNLNAVKIKLAEGFEIFSFNIWNYSFSNKVRVSFYMLSSNPTEDGDEGILLHHDFDICRDKNNNIFDTVHVTDIILDELKPYNIDFMLVDDGYNEKLVNVSFIKPSVSGKYKTNVRLTKPIKNITKYRNSYHMASFCVTSAVGGIKIDIDRNRGVFNSRNNTIVKDKKLLESIKKKYHDVVENYKNIDFTGINKFHIYRNRSSIIIENIRLVDGSSISLDMLPDSKGVLKKIVSCLDDDEYIVSNGAQVLNFKNVMNDDIYEMTAGKNYDGTPADYLIFTHKKNDISANALCLYEQDFDEMLTKPNIDDELEEKIITYKLLTMLE